jgi:hypothetical protein
MNTLVRILVVVIILGLVFWLLTLIPIPEPFFVIARVLVVVIAIVWLLNLAGLVNWPNRPA